MKIAIIGAGNMGGAIARGIAKNISPDFSLLVSNPSRAKLEALVAEYPFISVSTNNIDVVTSADILILAVKPWILSQVAQEMREVIKPTIIISVVAGYDTERLEELFGKEHAYFYVIPNTAILAGEGMTFITSKNADGPQIEIAKYIFSTMGKVAVIEERLMSAGMALCSCSIAYVYKFIQAMTQAGVELGFRPKEAMEYAVQTVSGAASMMKREGASPQHEIDRVTTPGGLTIKGINNLEKSGFVFSVIEAVKRPLEKD